MLRQLSYCGIRTSHIIRGPSIGPVCERFLSNDVSNKRCEGFNIESKNKVLWIKFDRPKKFNAITRDMYLYLTETFEQINSDDTHKAIVLTGTGEYYSSGNDLSNIMLAMKHEKGPRDGMIECAQILKRFVNSLINLEKILVAGINGPALGVSVSTLALFDHVVASEKATFQTPFTALGQCPEACSSVTFPQIVGAAKANELLLFNMTWDAKRACDSGLISSIVPHNQLDDYLDNLLYGKKGIVNGCYSYSTKISKSLIRNMNYKQILIDANNKECDEILELWLGEESMQAMQKFFAKSK